MKYIVVKTFDDFSLESYITRLFSPKIIKFKTFTKYFCNLDLVVSMFKTAGRFKSFVYYTSRYGKFGSKQLKDCYLINIEDNNFSKRKERKWEI